jgi:hypothetical protein
MTRQFDIPSLTTNLENGQAGALKQAFQGLGLDQRINLLDLVEAQNKQDRQSGKTKTELTAWHNIPTTKDLLSDDKDDLADEVPDDHVNLGLTMNQHKGMLGGLFSGKVIYNESYYPLNNRLTGDGASLNTKDDSAINIPQLTIQLEGGNGSALKQAFQGIGLDERIKILDDIVAQNAKDIKADGSTPKLRESHSISDLQLDTYDPHLDLDLSRSTQKGLIGAFKGDILYSEEYYPRSNRDLIQAKDVK